MDPRNNALNERQQEAVDHGNGPILIAAGAGSGKTKTLTTRLMKIIERGVNPANIIAITFTNKAANEMKERVQGAGEALGRSPATGEAEKKQISLEILLPEGWEKLFTP